MLSALISSKLGYPAMRLAPQQVRGIYPEITGSQRSLFSTLELFINSYIFANIINQNNFYDLIIEY